MSIARKLIIADEALPPPENFQAEMLLIGGGGGGGKGSSYEVGGGGGAGRFLRGSDITLTTQEVYQIVCGDGGWRGPPTSAAFLNGKGNDTTFTGSLSGYVATAVGGGRGKPGSYTYTDGGCGGGGDLYTAYGSDTSALSSGFDSGFSAANVLNQGLKGGNGEFYYPPLTYSNSGGGGGSRSSGGDMKSSGGGYGGLGMSDSITGTSVVYAGGGGGGAYTGTGGLADTPDAGQGGYGSNPGEDATRGCGGGGASGADQNRVAGKGGDGIVIIRSQKTALATTGTFTLYTDGIYNIYEFTTSGSISFV